MRRRVAIAWIAVASTGALDEACNAILGNQEHELALPATDDASAATDARADAFDAPAERQPPGTSLDASSDTAGAMDGLPGHGDGAFDSGADNASDAAGETSVIDAPMSMDSQLADGPMSTDSQPADASTSMDSQPADAQTSADSQPSDGSPAADGGPSGPAGLLYYFPLAGDTKDYSGNGNDAKNNGATLTTGHSGNPNSAYLFDGTSSYMVAPGALLPLGNTARTLTLWANPSTRLDGIASWGKGNCIGLMFGIGTQGHTFWGGCDDVGNGVGLPLGTWAFGAVVFTPPNHVRIFINAAATTYTLTTNLDMQPSSLWIGAETTTNSSLDFFSHLGGAMDSIRIYGRALSDAEVATIMALDW